ncbi:redoxin domain-containing protein, partial [Klebsiella pneumoniae]
RFSLEAQARRGPVVLIFYRGTWCPYCVEQLIDVARLLPAFAQAGAAVAAIAPAAAMAEAERLLGFPLLTDQGNRVARLYGLTWRIPADIAGSYRG